MKSITILGILFLCSTGLLAQKSIGYQSGVTSEQNLKTIVNISPYAGALGFDNRYLGVKGTPRLFDTLITTSFLISGEEKYYRMHCDLDLVRNTLLIAESTSGEVMEIKSDHIEELIIHKDDGDLLFKTTAGARFDKEVQENKFYEVLTEGPYQFIKIPVKEFYEADYQRVYSPDRRYDEFKLVSRYYIQGPDSVFYRVQLTRKSLIKAFPDKKELIESNFNEKTASDPEADIITLLNKF